jgi:hypothetical protein
MFSIAIREMKDSREGIKNKNFRRLPPEVAAHITILQFYFR